MITLDPDTAAPDPEVLRNVARTHDRMAGVYGAVVAEGMIRAGDAVEILD
jgi:MOSC domain-containing protein YiiM